MIINEDGWLEKDEFDDPDFFIEIVKTPNFTSHQWAKFYRYGVCFHWDACLTSQIAINSIMSPRSPSAHLNFKRNGDIIQFVSFNDISWHAGLEAGVGWKNPATGETMNVTNYANPNFYFIGIEFSNVGMILEKADGTKKCGHMGGNNWAWDVPATMKLREFNPPLENNRYWEDVYEPQVATCKKVFKLIVNTYGITREWVVDHRYIMPAQKSDCISIDWKQYVDEAYAEIEEEKKPY
jgi:N-acetyl-anhydromuramyl-L-alanine amidase AmpD